MLRITALASVRLSTPGPTTIIGCFASFIALTKPEDAALPMSEAAVPRCVYSYVRSAGVPIRPT